MRLMSRFTYASCVAMIIAAGATAAQERGGLITGSFGDMPLELTISADLAGATIIGTYADASLLATQMDGNQGPVTLTLIINGELPDPGEVTLDIAFARDMGRNWTGDESSLALQLETFEVTGPMITVAGTVTGEVTGGTAQETRPVTFSFNMQLEELD